MIVRADARALPLADGCVQCVVTSPPYWGLRDYGNNRQLGAEQTPQTYVQNIMAVFAEVWRVLRDDGTVWLNLGDSYATSGGFAPNAPSNVARAAGDKSGAFHGERRDTALARTTGGRKAPIGLKPKDLVGIPWRVAFGLQAVGWYLRSDIIWSKLNPMPESVRDRPTKSHEYVFLLSKSERYYYDQSAIYERYAESTLREVADGYDGLGLKDYAAAGVQNPSNTKRRIIEGITKKRTVRAGIDVNGGGQGNGAITFSGDGRNKRTVWTIPTLPFKGAHFATMPEALVEPCILAGCPLGGLVLDPFCGTFTVGAVAARLGRRAVGVDLSYQALAKQRTRQRGLMFSPDEGPQLDPLDAVAKG